MNELGSEQKKDLKVMVSFIGLYCRLRHRGAAAPASGLAVDGVGLEKVRLCHECTALLAYAVEKRRKCPLNPKPSCKHCPIHCYGREYRAKIREVMAFSGKRMILRGRLDLLWHYFF